MALIEVRDLEKIYATDEGVATQALRGVTFDIQDGEFVAIMGPSGSGKSTLLQILGFLDRQTGGTYRFSGSALHELRDDALAHVRNEKMGFVFQAFNLLPRTSVLENVMLPLLYSHIPEREWDGCAREAIESVGLAHRMHHEPSQLSGGERQRVAIARAIVNKPEIVFADEPTGNLDSKSGGVVMELFDRLNKSGRTVVLITHETYTAERAQRIITLFDGTIESDRTLDGAIRETGAFRK